MQWKRRFGNRVTVAVLRIAVAALATTVACTEPPDEGTGGGIDAAADTPPDTPLDVAMEAQADAAPEASPDGESDHWPAVDLTGDVVAPVDVVADVEADVDEPSPRFQVIECTFEAAGFRMHARIWSDGTLDKNGNLPRLSLTPEGKLLDTDLAALLEASRIVNASTAGTTTTTGPPFHSSSRSGRLESRGRPEQPFVLVESLEDGRALGRRTYVRHNDPAADVVRRFSCVDLM